MSVTSTSVAGLSHELTEQLSDAEHDSWARWQAYVFSRCVELDDGSMLIPADLVERWRRQIATRYDLLSEADQQKDRDEVARIAPLIEAAFRAEIERLVDEVETARRWAVRLEQRLAVICTPIGHVGT